VGGGIVENDGVELMDPPPEIDALTQVGQWEFLSDAHEYALVVLAMNLACEVRQTGGIFTLHAELEELPRIRHEFALYAAEQAGVMPQREPAEGRTYPWGIEWFVGWAAAMFFVFVLQAQDPSFTGRFANSSQALVEDREVWRPFTALFLHADPGHFLGNVAIGGIFCMVVSRSLGAALGWPLILAGGTLANALNAWLRYPEPFASIGASTATFAALGILVGHATGIAWKSRSTRGMRSVLVPVIAGFILLGWYGSGGENTDVAAHFWGWVVGALFGLAAGIRAERPDSQAPAATADS
jgi:rhomboid protease GluP